MYMKDDCCKYDGKIYRSKVDNNVYNPKDYPQNWEEVEILWREALKIVDMFSQILWAALPSLLTGIILSVWNSRQKRREIVRDEKEADRRKSEMLRISLLVATAQLSRAVAMAIKRGSPNGEIEEGLEQYNMAMEEFREFEREQIVKNQ